MTAAEPPTFSIRPAGPGDAAAVRDLLNAFERDPWGEGRDALLKPAYAVSQLLTLSAWLDTMAGELDE